MEPRSTVDTQTFSSVVAKFFSLSLPSISARLESPRVHANIDAIELVEVSSPRWCAR